LKTTLADLETNVANLVKLVIIAIDLLVMLFHRFTTMIRPTDYLETSEPPSFICELESSRARRRAPPASMQH